MTADADWAKKTLESAINEIISGGLFDNPFLQARPVWQIGGSLLIAECQAGEDRYWLAAEKLKAGEVATPSNLTADELVKRVAHLIRCAESLHELAQQTSIWE